MCVVDLSLVKHIFFSLAVPFSAVFSCGFMYTRDLAELPPHDQMFVTPI